MRFPSFNLTAFAIVLMCLTVSPPPSHGRVKVMQIKQIGLDSGVVTVSGVEGDASNVQLRVENLRLLSELKVGDTVGVNLEEKNMMIMVDVTMVTADAGPERIVGAVNKAKEEANRLACSNNLRQLGLAVQMYANQYKGRFPRDLGTLYAAGVIDDPKTVVCPDKPAAAVPKDFARLTAAEKAAWINANSSFAYTGGGLKSNVANPSEVVVLYENPPTHGDDAVGVSFADAHFERVAPERWAELQTLQLGSVPRGDTPVARIDLKNNLNESLEFTATTKDGKPIARSLLQPPGVSLPAGDYVLQHNRRTIAITVPAAAAAPSPPEPSSSLRRPQWLANLVVNPNNANLMFTEYDGPLMRCYNSRSMFNGPLGYGWSFDYSTHLRKNDKGIFEIVEADGFVTTYQPTQGGHHRAVVASFPSELIEEKGRLVRRFEGSGYMDKFRRPVCEEAFSPEGRLISIKHSSGDVHEVQYEAGIIKAVVHKASGRVLYAFARDANGHITQMTTPSGQHFTYSYKGKGLATVTDPGGAKKSYEYSDFHNLTGITYPDASRAALKYDEEKDWLSSTVADGFEEHFKYGEEGAGHLWTTRTDKNGNVMRWDFYEGAATLVSTMEPISTKDDGAAVERDPGGR